MNFKSTFKKLREEKGLTIEELAIELKIPYTTLLKYESGEIIPGEEILKKFADFFDVSVDYLLGKTNVRKVDYSLLTEDDKKEISNILEERRYESENSNEFLFDGERLSQECIDSLIEAMQIGLSIVKIKHNKELHI